MQSIQLQKLSLEEALKLAKEMNSLSDLLPCANVEHIMLQTGKKIVVSTKFDYWEVNNNTISFNFDPIQNPLLFFEYGLMTSKLKFSFNTYKRLQGLEMNYKVFETKLSKCSNSATHRNQFHNPNYSVLAKTTLSSISSYNSEIYRLNSMGASMKSLERDHLREQMNRTVYGFVQGNAVGGIESDENLGSHSRISALDYNPILPNGVICIEYFKISIKLDVFASYINKMHENIKMRAFILYNNIVSQQPAKPSTMSNESDDDSDDGIEEITTQFSGNTI
jgi:hypothetical protein